MLDALPVELVQLVAVRLPAPSIAALALVCRHTAACLSEPAFWCAAAVHHGVPRPLVEAAASAGSDARALLRETTEAVLFDAVARVRPHGLAFSPTGHACAATDGEWNSVMSARVLGCWPAPHVLCWRVAWASVRNSDMTYRVGVTTLSELPAYDDTFTSALESARVCAIGEYRQYALEEWSAGVMPPRSAFPGPGCTEAGFTMARDARQPGFVVMLVARSTAQPRTAIVVALTLCSASESDASAVVQMCFWRRLELESDADASFSAVASLSGAGVGCMCVRPPRALVARAAELVAHADEQAAVADRRAYHAADADSDGDDGDASAGDGAQRAVYIEHMHGVVVDAPRLLSPDDASFVDFLAAQPHDRW